jgi:hypothetical protein
LQLIQLLVRDLLIFDASADRLLIPPDGRNEITPRPEFVPKKSAQLAEYFGGIDISMCTWSGIRCPSSILHSLRWAKLAEYSAQVPPDLPKQRLLAVLRREHNAVLALPCRVVQVIMIL